MIRVVPRQRPDNDIEGWNLGLMSAQRPELTPAENRLRMGELRADISNRFGRFQVRRRYIPMLGAEPIEERAFLLISKADDSGNLKGFLRKVGREFGQDAVGQNRAFENAMALVGCPDRRIHRLCITCFRPPNRHITPDAWCDLVHAASAGPSGTVEFTPNRVPDAIWIDHHEGKSRVIRQLLSHCKGFCRCKRSRLRGAYDHLLAQS